MKRFRSFRTGVSGSSPQDRQAALTGFTRPLATGLNGQLRKGSVLGDGRAIRGNSNEKTVRVTFQKPNLPTMVAHRIGWTVTNWNVIDVKPAATIGRSRRRATRDVIYLEALDNGSVGSDGKFDPPVVATIAVWGEPGPEPRRRRS